MLVVESISVLKKRYVDTPIGQMIAIANDEALYLLEFVERKGIESEIERLGIKTQSHIISGACAMTEAIAIELEQYFLGKLIHFKTKIALLGTPFQKKVWQTLSSIPYGETRSYSSLARAIAQPTACRAVAQANSANQLAIIIPCHRVIQANQHLGGYAGGVARKQWLIDHEQALIR